MKKLLTVLLVIAVICTFSFGSAFAAVPYQAKGTEGDVLYTTGDVTGNGEYGITEAEKAYIVASLTDAVEAGFDAEYYGYADKVEELYNAAIAGVKAATTAKEAYTIYNGLLSNGTSKGSVIKLKDAINKAKNEIVKASNTNVASATSSFARVLQRNANYDLILEGYGVLASTTDGTEKINGLDTVSYTDWLLDNGYVAEDKEDVLNGIAALVLALKPINTTYADAVAATTAKLQDTIWTYEDKYHKTSRGNAISAADLEGLNTLWTDITTYQDTYVGYVGTLDTTTLASATEVAVDKYFSVYDAEMATIPDVKKLTDADKATVLALYNKYDALLEEFVAKYPALEDYANLEDDVVDYEDYLKKAYTHFLAADVKAYGDLEDFEEIKCLASNTSAYFDDSEKNVKALEAKKAAYDALLADYGYFASNDVDYVEQEAKFLAAEHNQKAAAGFDAKDEDKATSIVKTYLNNATVTVKSTKLAAKKVRVQAKVDTTTLSLIVKELGAGSTVEYKFYHKAPGKAFKLTKTKDVNYITYTSKSLKKGKNSFRVGLVIKDADGKVVATKDYQASTLAYRTIK